MARTTSTFAQRVGERKVDLVKVMNEGILPLESLPGSEGMLLRGKRHYIPAPQKEGKSLALLVHWAQMVLAGAVVVIFDRENGSQIYAQRLQDILASWKVNKGDLRRVRAHLRYYEYPILAPGDGPDLVKLCARADVVVFDAQRMFLTDLGLAEDLADDYAEWMAQTIDPLFRAGIATVILDNTGHENKDRGRGSSSKGDLNEVLFTLKAELPFSREQIGRIRLTIRRSRFGNTGQWDMDIGGGVYSGWCRTDKELEDDPQFRAAVTAALKAAQPGGLSTNKLLEAVREAGKRVGRDRGRALLAKYAAEANDPIVAKPGEKNGTPTLYFLPPSSTT
jgi:hypothetical protein